MRRKVIFFLLMTASINLSAASTHLVSTDFSSGYENHNPELKVSGRNPKVVTTPSCTGGKSVEFSVTAPAFRSELVPKGKAKDLLFHEDYWFSFSVLVPDIEGNSDPGYGTIIMQVHGRPDFDIGESWRGPIASLTYREGIFRANAWADHRPNSYQGGARSRVVPRAYELARVIPNKWTDFVVHVRIDYSREKPKGAFRVWIDGDQWLNYEGRIGYNDKRPPYIKFGNYTPALKNRNGIRRSVYIDNFKMVKGDIGSFEELDPKCRYKGDQTQGGKPTEPPVPPTGVQVEIVK